VRQSPQETLVRLFQTGRQLEEPGRFLISFSRTFFAPFCFLFMLLYGLSSGRKCHEIRRGRVLCHLLDQACEACADCWVSLISCRGGRCRRCERGIFHQPGHHGVRIHAGDGTSALRRQRLRGSCPPECRYRRRPSARTLLSAGCENACAPRRALRAERRGMRRNKLFSILSDEGVESGHGVADAGPVILAAVNAVSDFSRVELCSSWRSLRVPQVEQ